MCPYVWEQGSHNTSNLFIRLVDLASVGDRSSDIKTQIIGTEGGGIVPRTFDDDSDVDIDNVAGDEKPGIAELGMANAKGGFFTVYFYGLPKLGVGHFQLKFKGSAPADLIGKGISGNLVRLTEKTKFGPDTSWISWH